MNTIWGDSTTMEIEMNGMMGDDYDYTLLHCPGGYWDVLQTDG